VLEALISACRADLKHALAEHSLSAKAQQKSMKINIYKDSVQRMLKSLKFFSVGKLSTTNPIRSALSW
jgi:hypothetical protein